MEVLMGKVDSGDNSCVCPICGCLNKITKSSGKTSIVSDSCGHFRDFIEGVLGLRFMFFEKKGYLYD
jgi:hypothetical protein